MPLSVTCQCGSKLEIDEKFLGKEILCPDCQRPLPTTVPAMPPPLEMPGYRRVSGLAVLSLALALVGAFTIVGTIAAIAVGIYALKQIAAKPSRLEGVNFARAGITVGAFCTVLTLTALISPTVFGLDGFLRDMAFAGQIHYHGVDTIKHETGAVSLEIQPPKPNAHWAQYSPNPQTYPNPDLLILVDTRDDAFIACQSFEIDDVAPGLDDLEKKAFERFGKSELVNILSKNRGMPPGEPAIVEKKLRPDGAQEIIFDIRLGGIDRRCILIYPTNRKVLIQVDMLVGCARRARFERIQEGFSGAYTSLKIGH